MKLCVWEKYSGKYITTCGHQAHVIGRGWDYCPYCGNFLEISRKMYQANYHKKNKDKHAEYYKGYYKEHR